MLRNGDLVSALMPLTARASACSLCLHFLPPCGRAVSSGSSPPWSLTGPSALGAHASLHLSPRLKNGAGDPQTPPLPGLQSTRSSPWSQEALQAYVASLASARKVRHPA